MTYYLKKYKVLWVYKLRTAASAILLLETKHAISIL